MLEVTVASGNTGKAKTQRYEHDNVLIALQSRFKDVLTKGEYNYKVMTSGQNYLELFDTQYDICFDKTDLKHACKAETGAPSWEDDEERSELIDETYEAVKEILHDSGTRQCIIRKNAQITESVAACPSLFQFIVRDKKLYLFVFVRSQHVRNVAYDAQTFMLMFKACLDRLELSNEWYLEPGAISVHVTSLHVKEREIE